MAYPNVIKEEGRKKDSYLCEWVNREEMFFYYVNTMLL